MKKTPIKARRWTRHGGFYPLGAVLHGLPPNHLARRQYEDMLHELDQQMTREVRYLMLGVLLGAVAATMMILACSRLP